MPPDGDFRYDPHDIYTPRPKPKLAGLDADLVRNLVIPMVSERSREPGDAWEQAEKALREILS